MALIPRSSAFTAGRTCVHVLLKDAYLKMRENLVKPWVACETNLFIYSIAEKDDFSN